MLDGCDDDDGLAVLLVYSQSEDYRFLVGTPKCLRLMWYRFKRESNVHGEVMAGSRDQKSFSVRQVWRAHYLAKRNALPYQA